MTVNYIKYLAILYQTMEPELNKQKLYSQLWRDKNREYYNAMQNIYTKVYNLKHNERRLEYAREYQMRKRIEAGFGPEPRKRGRKLKVVDGHEVDENDKVVCACGAHVGRLYIDKHKQTAKHHNAMPKIV